MSESTPRAPDGREERGGPDVARAREDALRLLSHRARSESEMRRRLAKKGHESAVIEDVVEWLLDREYLNDREFARQFLAERLSRKPRGRFALVQELRKRGISRSLAESMVGAVMEEEGLDEDDLARAAADRWLDRQSPATRSLLRSGEPDDDAEAARRRLYGHLERRGFRRETARRILERVLEELRTGGE